MTAARTLLPLVEMDPELAGSIMFALSAAAEAPRSLGIAGPNVLDKARVDFDAAFAARCYPWDVES